MAFTLITSFNITPMIFLLLLVFFLYSGLHPPLSSFQTLLFRSIARCIKPPRPSDSVNHRMSSSQESLSNALPSGNTWVEVTVSKFIQLWPSIYIYSIIFVVCISTSYCHTFAATHTCFCVLWWEPCVVLPLSWTRRSVMPCCTVFSYSDSCGR